MHPNLPYAKSTRFSPLVHKEIPVVASTSDCTIWSPLPLCMFLCFLYLLPFVVFSFLILLGFGLDLILTAIIFSSSLGKSTERMSENHYKYPKSSCFVFIGSPCRFSLPRIFFIKIHNSPARFVHVK